MYMQICIRYLKRRTSMCRFILKKGLVPETLINCFIYKFFFFFCIYLERI